MSNVYSNPQFKAQKGYNGFPMNQEVKFSSPTGMLIPVYYDFLQPGDKVNMSVEMKTRTLALESSAFATINEQVDYFFVPMEQIYKFFGSVYYGVNDIDTSLIDTDDVVRKFPYFDFSSLVAAIGSTLCSGDQTTITGRLTYDDFYNYQDYGTIRLCDALGIPVSAALGDKSFYMLNSSNQWSPNFTYSLNLFKFAAYQKIYYDYYRLEDRVENFPQAYNLDQFYNSNSAVSITWLQALMQPRYRAWRKDYFSYNQTSPLMPSQQTNVSTAPLYGENDVNLLAGSNLGTIVNYLTGKTTFVTTDTAVGNTVPVGGNTVAYNNNSAGFNMKMFNTADIRNMFAIEKLLEVTRRAGKTYDMQTLAHFGVKVPTGISGMVNYLGTHENTIYIGDVVATAGTDSTPLGEIGGKGYGYKKNGNIQFEAKSHGILMAIYSAAPSRDFFTNQFDKKDLALYREDLPIPEFDNLGMQPIYQYEGSQWYNEKPTNTTNVYTGSIIRGWQYRYMEYKSKFDRIFGSLQFDLSHWTLGQCAFSPFGLDIPTPTWQYTDLQNYLVPPNALDKIMLVKYNWTPTIGVQTENGVSTLLNIYSTDPLIHDFYFNVSKASKMSTYGLPSL